MYANVFNPGDSPVVIDESGRSVGGGEYASVETTDSAAADAIGAGRLVKVDEPEGDVDRRYYNSQAVDTFEETRRRSERADQLEGKDKAQLEKIARKQGVIGEDEDVKVGDLRRRLVESQVDLKASTPAQKAAAPKSTDSGSSAPSKEKE